MSIVIGLGLLALVGAHPSPSPAAAPAVRARHGGDGRAAAGQEGAYFNVVENHCDYDLLPRKQAADVELVRDLVDTRVLVEEVGAQGTLEVVEHYVLAIRYAKRDGRSLIVEYEAIRSDDSLIQYVRPEQAGDVPIERLEDAHVGTEVYVPIAPVPEGRTEREFRALAEEARSRRPQGGDPSRWLALALDPTTRKAFERTVNAWFHAQVIVLMRIDRVEFHVDAQGVLRTGRLDGTTYAENDPSKPVSMRFDGPAGGTTPAGLTLCPLTLFLGCRDICIGSCSAFPACDCSFIGICLPRSSLRCVGLCPVGPGVCRFRLRFFFPFWFRIRCEC